MSNLITIRVATKLTYSSGHVEYWWWAGKQTNKENLTTKLKDNAKKYKLNADLLEALEEYSLLFDERPNVPDLQGHQPDLFDTQSEPSILREVYIEVMDPLLE